MSKADKIQAKIWKAYGKAGKILGYLHDVYRSQHLTTPIQPKNHIDTKLVGFSLDYKYKKAPSESLPVWMTWIDGRLEALFNLQRGDFLVNLDTNETYYIASAETHNTIQAIKCDNTVSVSRAGYGDAGTGFAPGDTEVATSLPCAIEIGSPKGGTLGYVPAATHLDEALQTAIVWTWDPRDEIQVRDVLTDSNSRKWQVMSTEQTDIGTKLVVRADNP